MLHTERSTGSNDDVLPVLIKDSGGRSSKQVKVTTILLN